MSTGRTSSFFVSLLLILWVVGVASSGDVSLSESGLASLQGKARCLQKRDFAFQIDEKRGSALVQVDSDAVLLLANAHPPEYCGRVEAILDLTRLARQGEIAYFKSRIESKGHTRWGRVIGLGNNHQGKKRFITARLAWRVNIKERRFADIEGQRVTCDTTGFIYGNGWY
jgi:hypothetical protein